uniref:PH domain-containing protein n=1 Tax=Periophthalmus magnuspinnatus TaxID=409849 RepID=A0A3B3ZML6_9GOBI
MEGDPDLQFLLSGGNLVKIRSNSWQKNRFYKLNEDCKTIWHDSHKIIRRSKTSLDDIDSVRRGRQSEGLNKHTDPSVEDRCFSIIFKGKKKNLDLMAADPEQAKKWVNGLEKVISNLQNLSRQMKKEWLINCMRKADKNKD